MDGIPISGPMLCEKAIDLSKRLFGDEASFIANEGWKWCFCKRHGIRNLSLQGEKLSADNEGAESFVTSFHAFVEEENRSIAMKLVFCTVFCLRKLLQHRLMAENHPKIE